MATTITKETLQPQQGTSASSMAEDESLKRNTDCVYFLASPLTCKKGNECEYRHSEYARMNPRDCWYWMNGNCLNPKCSFRHPPLDGLVSPQAGNFAGPPAIVQPGPPVPAAPQNPTKQGVPCIFFQKGFCLKGDRCPFMHGPNPTSTKMQQVSASNAAPEAPAFKKNFGSLEKCTQLKMNSNVNKPKVLEAPPQSKAILKVQSSRPVNGEPSGRGYQPPHVFEEASKYQEMKPFSVDNGRSRSGHAHHGGSYDDRSLQNGRDADESLRESSPGFDVLVDDKLSEDENYPDDQYSRMRGHDRRNPKEFDMGHQDEYYPAADVDSEIYHNRRGYDSFDRVPDKYGWDHRRASSERSLGEPAHYDRRGPFKSVSQSPDLNQNSDLRCRLSKQRRINGLKSVVTSDYGFDDHHSEDRDYRSARKDSRRSPVHETSRGNRLHGRIKLPRRPSPMNGNDMDPDRETERGRNWGRLSPSRQQVSGLQGRLRDRLGGRIQDETRDGRRINGPMASQVAIAGADFAAPKRLSELRGSQQSDSKQQQLKSQQSVAGGKLRDTVLASSIATEGDLSFEGPKPLSEILKRKRTTPTGINSDNKEEIKPNENNVNSAANSVKHVALSSAIEQDEGSEVYNKPLAVEADEEGEILNKKTKLDGEGEFLLPEPDDNKHPEAEEDLAAVDGEEQEYDEEYDQGEDGDCDYEQADGFNLNEGETGDQEVDSMDEDDGDDFAKKLGVSF